MYYYLFVKKYYFTNALSKMLMAKSRTQNAILNSLYGIASALTMIILNFAVRYFLVKSLGDEYYGLHRFFSEHYESFRYARVGD